MNESIHTEMRFKRQAAVISADEVALLESILLESILLESILLESILPEIIHAMMQAEELNEDE